MNEEIKFVFLLKKIFWKYPKLFAENPVTNQNFIAHVLKCNSLYNYDGFVIFIF